MLKQQRRQVMTIALLRDQRASTITATRRIKSAQTQVKFDVPPDT